EDACAGYRIPDSEFVISLVDWPVSSHRPPYIDIPVFTFCKTARDRVFLLPAARFGIDEAFPVAPGDRWRDRCWKRIFDRIPSVNELVPWSAKERRVFFAGQANSFRDVRWRYGELALEHPELFLARFTRIVESDNSEQFAALQALFGEPISLAEIT